MARRRLTTFLATVVLATGLSAGPALAFGGGLLADPLGEVGGTLQDTTEQVTGLLDGGSDAADEDGPVAGVVDDASDALAPVTDSVGEVADTVAGTTRQLADTTDAEPLDTVADAVEQVGAVLSPEPTPPAPEPEGPAPATSSRTTTRAVVPPGVRAAEGLPLTGAPDLDLATPRAAAAATARAMAAPRQEMLRDPAVAPPAARDDAAAVASPQVAAPSGNAQQVVRAVRDVAAQVPPGLRAAAAAMVLAVLGGLVLHRDELLADLARLGRG